METNEDQKYVETISEKNTDLESIKNIERPKSSKIINSTFPVNKLFGIWTTDPNGPHADFQLGKESFFVVDYDGDGDMPYEINKNIITVYYPDMKETGLIQKAEKDSLVIYWASGECITYTRWKN